MKPKILIYSSDQTVATKDYFSTSHIVELAKRDFEVRFSDVTDYDELTGRYDIIYVIFSDPAPNISYESYFTKLKNPTTIYKQFLV